MWITKRPDIGHALTSVSIAVTLAPGVIALIRDCRQDTRISDLNYSSTAIQFRPLMKILGEPQLVSYTLADPKLESQKDIFKSGTDSIVDISVTLKLRLRLKAVNAGSAVSRICAVAWGDTVSGGPRLRELILKGDLSGFQALPDTAFFKTRGLVPGDTTVFEQEQEIHFGNDSSFTVHFIILYMNEMDVLYDTYYWARYSMGELIVRPEVRIHEGRFQGRFREAKGSFRELFQLSGSNQDPFVYSRKQSSRVLAELDALSERR